MIIERPCTTCGYSLEKGVKLVAIADVVIGCFTVVVCSTLIAHFDEMTSEGNDTLVKITSTEASFTESDFTFTTMATDSMTTDNLNDNLFYIPDNATDTLNVTEGTFDESTTEFPSLSISTAAKTDKRNQTRKHRKRHHHPPDYTFEWVVLIVMLIFGAIQICMVQLLYFGLKQKSVSSLYIWLIISGFSIPATGFLIKMYEMIVVFAYSEEVKAEKHGEALEEFRKLPYICNIQTQLYPHSRYGVKRRCAHEYRNGAFRSSFRKNQNDDEDDFGEDGFNNKCPLFQNKSFIMNVPGSMFSVVQHNSKST